MGKRRITDDGGVSLFPFMSILACLIGILTLMISVMTQLNSSDTAGQSEEEISRAKKRSQLITLAEGLEVELEELDKRIQKERASALQLTQVREEVAAVRGQLRELGNAAPDPSAIQQQIHALQGELVKLRQESDPLAKRIKQLEAEIKERKEAPEPPKSIQVRPGTDWDRPSAVFFVECHDQGIHLIIPKGKAVPVKTADIPTSKAYRDFLTKIKTVRDPMVLYLIRSTGYSNYRWAAHEAIQKFQLRTGKLPLPHNGKLDLSDFQN